MLPTYSCVPIGTRFTNKGPITLNKTDSLPEATNCQWLLLEVCGHQSPSSVHAGKMCCFPGPAQAAQAAVRSRIPQSCSVQKILFYSSFLAAPITFLFLLHDGIWALEIRRWCTYPICGSALHSDLVSAFWPVVSFYVNYTILCTNKPLWWSLRSILIYE